MVITKKIDIFCYNKPNSQLFIKPANANIRAAAHIVLINHNGLYCLM